jgi:hypothetical protein
MADPDSFPEYILSSPGRAGEACSESRFCPILQESSEFMQGLSHSFCGCKGCDEQHERGCLVFLLLVDSSVYPYTFSGLLKVFVDCRCHNHDKVRKASESNRSYAE